MSALVFAAACGPGSQPARTTPPPAVASPLAGVPITPWPKQGAKLPAWRVGTKPVYAIITVGGSDAAAIVWVTSNGSDLSAVYCVDQEQLSHMRAQIIELRGSHHDGFMEVKIQPGKHTDVCGAPTSAGTPPAPPPPPPIEPTGAKSPTEVHCPNESAICNFVMPSPKQTGPGGEPPTPELVWKLDEILWSSHVFVNVLVTPTRGGL